MFADGVSLAPGQMAALWGASGLRQGSALTKSYDPVRHQKWISNFACRNCLEVCIRKRNYDPFLGIPAAFPHDYVSHVVAKQCTDEVAVRLNLVRHEYHPLTSSAGVAGAKDKEDGSKGSVSA